MSKRHFVAGMALGVGLSGIAYGLITLAGFRPAPPGKRAAEAAPPSAPACTPCESESATATVAALPQPPAVPAPPRPRAPQQDQDAGTETDGIPAEVAGMLAMYEDLGDVVDTHDRDCTAIGRAFWSIIERNEQVVKEAASNLRALSPEERSEYHRQLHEAHGQQLQKAQERVQRAFRACHSDDAVADALRQLAATGR